MSRRYPGIAFGDSVKSVQREQGSRALGERLEGMSWDDQELGSRERALIEGLDHFYMASVTESGWPYVQFRGGPKGFVRMLSPRTLGFADFRGNRQYISTGNVAHDDRVSLLFRDQARRLRLKIFARASAIPMTAELHDRLVDPEYDAVVERAYVFAVEAFDWNCPQHITPRFSMEEIQELAPESVADSACGESARIA